MIIFAPGEESLTIEIDLISKENSGMHFGFFLTEEINMHRDVIEEIVISEFKGLCSSCVHLASCGYFKKNSHKAVIQCELFEVDDEVVLPQNIPDGLCRNCDLAAECRLPGRRMGTWHCNEFQ
ncbi:MAG TPA: hypothetical protein VK589_27780 [Chryseolinea sp.]|nr:hypothetical protein [Chryseolinea sp.]